MAWRLPDGAVLGIFGERPESGRVQSRLAAEFGEEFATEAHAAMLFDTIDLWASETILAPGGRRVFVFAPEDSGPWFDARVPDAFSLQAQSEGNFGRRLQRFFEGEFADGADRVVALFADAPTLDPTIVVSAFLCLETRDVVLGPDTGGGSYLVGAKRTVPPIFDAIDRDAPTVLSQTVDRLKDVDLSLAVLPPWYSVKTPDQWRMLVGHVRGLERSGAETGLPRLLDLIARHARTRTQST